MLHVCIKSKKSHGKSEPKLYTKEYVKYKNRKNIRKHLKIMGFLSLTSLCLSKQCFFSNFSPTNFIYLYTARDILVFPFFCFHRNIKGSWRHFSLKFSSTNIMQICSAKVYGMLFLVCLVT